MSLSSTTPPQAGATSTLPPTILYRPASVTGSPSILGSTSGTLSYIFPVESSAATTTTYFAGPSNILKWAQGSENVQCAMPLDTALPSGGGLTATCTVAPVASGTGGTESIVSFVPATTVSDLAQSSSTATTTATASPSTSSSSHSLIIGIVVGLAVLLILIAVVIWRWIQKKRKKDGYDAVEQNMDLLLEERKNEPSNLGVRRWKAPQLATIMPA
ncbi:hypothetical protein DL96DRAFT_1708384 [Flagelloscypha sp. PMI_526]|nr:hypothetical protein DL96DRAFT_1708384 [Flagelloscypha sp. PMI_526]